MSAVTFDHERRVVELEVPTAAIVAAAILVHGPLDVGVTLLAWHFESNPVVLLIGVEGFLAVKFAAIAALGGVWWGNGPSAWAPDRIEHWASCVMWGLAILLTAFGLAHVTLNVWMLAVTGLQGVLA